MTGPGQFAGKLLFASAGSDSAVYLTVFEVKGNGGKRIPVPGMAAKQATPAERTTLYRGDDGDTRIQLAGRWWIRADEGTGWLMLTEDGDDAAASVLSGPVTGTTWKVRTAEGTQAVTYSVDPLAPLLTTTDDAPGVFAPQIVIAGLQEIQRTKSVAGAGLRQVFRNAHLRCRARGLGPRQSRPERGRRGRRRPEQGEPARRQRPGCQPHPRRPVQRPARRQGLPVHPRLRHGATARRRQVRTGRRGHRLRQARHHHLAAR